jgi:hypothetical protein
MVDGTAVGAALVGETRMGGRVGVEVDSGGDAVGAVVAGAAGRAGLQATRRRTARARSRRTGE